MNIIFVGIFYNLILGMLDKLLSSIFDEEHEFNDIWQLKLVKFDTDLSEDMKPYQKHICASDLVEDSKGNPGYKGCFILSNLRIIWHSQRDKDINLSIGLDTLNNIMIKSMPVLGYSETKHLLTVKAVSPNQTKYQFKFTGYSNREEKIFKTIQEVFKKFAQTKSYRNIDTSIRFSNSQFIPIQGQQIKTRYDNSFFEQNDNSKVVVIIVTNIRVIIVHSTQVGTNYGIPWIMIEGFTKVSRNDREELEVKIRGILSNVEIYIGCSQKAQFSKMHKQIASFSQTYNRNPYLGVDFSNLEIEPARNNNFIKQTDIVQIQQTKVNIGRRKNAYGDGNQKGSIKQTFFNEELGIMMETLPEGYNRKDLWEILRP